MGQIIEYDWNVTLQPEGSDVVLSNESAMDPTFVPEVIGTYRLSLAVKDVNNTWSENEDTVNITVSPQGTLIPVANAGPDITIELGAQVVLDGTNSTDDLKVEMYLWTHESGAITLDIENETEATAYTTPVLIGSYQISLKVRDNDGFWSEPDYMTLTVIPENKAPVALIDSPSDGSEYLDSDIIEFDGTDSDDPEEGDLTFEWSSSLDGDLDSNSTFSSNLTAGLHTITLKVTDDHGLNGTETIDITVIEDTAPTAVLSVDMTLILKGDKVAFDASSSTDFESDIIEFMFDFGDGGVTTWQTKKKATHIYKDVGTYNATVTVRDPAGHETISEGIQIKIGVKPEAKLEADVLVIRVKKEMVLDSSGSTDEDGRIVSYLFDFGDDSDSGWTNESSVTHVYDKPGRYTVSVKVKDDDGLESTLKKVTITVKKAKEPGPSNALSAYLLPLILLIVILVVVIVVALYLKGRKGGAEGTDPGLDQPQYQPPAQPPEQPAEQPQPQEYQDPGQPPFQPPPPPPQ